MFYRHHAVHSPAFHSDNYLQILGERSRAPAAVDGEASHILNPGESVTVRSLLHPIPCINWSSISDPALDAQGEGPASGPGKEDDWVQDSPFIFSTTHVGVTKPF
jgi:hypothetical protein